MVCGTKSCSRWKLKVRPSREVIDMIQEFAFKAKYIIIREKAQSPSTMQKPNKPVDRHKKSILQELIARFAAHDAQSPVQLQHQNSTIT